MIATEVNVALASKGVNPQGIGKLDSVISARRISEIWGAFRISVGEPEKTVLLLRIFWGEQLNTSGKREYRSDLWEDQGFV